MLCHLNMASWVDRLGHKSSSLGKIRATVAKFRVPQQEGETYYDDGKMGWDLAMDLAEENVRLRYAIPYCDPETLKLRDNSVRLCEALGCGMQR